MKKTLVEKVLEARIASLAAQKVMKKEVMKGQMVTQMMVKVTKWVFMHYGGMEVEMIKMEMVEEPRTLMDVT